MVTELTADDDVLGAILDLRAPVGVHDGQVAGVQGAAGEELPRGLGVPVVALGADVAVEDDLADLLAVARDVDEDAPLRRLGLDDADGQARQEAVALPRHLPVPLRRGEGLPRRHVVALRYRAVSLRQAVDVDGVEV